MAKQTTVVFYPHTARIYVGDYEHKGDESFVCDPVSTPRGIPLEYWKLDNGIIKEMSDDEKAERDILLSRDSKFPAFMPIIEEVKVEKPIEEPKPIVHQTIIQGLNAEDLEEELSALKTEFNQRVSEQLKDFYEHLDYIEKNNNLDSRVIELKVEFLKQIKDLETRSVKGCREVAETIKFEVLKKHSDAITKLDIELSEKLEELKKDLLFELNMHEIAVLEVKRLNSKPKKDYLVAKIIGISALTTIVIHFLMR